MPNIRSELQVLTNGISTGHFFVFLLSFLPCFILATGQSVKAAPGQVLLLESSVATPANTSIEYLALQNQGYVAADINVASNSTWMGLNTPDFSDYDAIIIGDPLCSASGGAVSVLTATYAKWNAAITGNVVIVGTDPSVHSPGGMSLTDKAIAFSLADAPNTGAYITLSCYYHGALSNTAVPWLDDLSTVGISPRFTVTGVGCFNASHIVATHPALVGLTDGDLSGWGCSVHEAFDSWPGDFLVLAIAQGAGTTYTASDGTIGVPYIIARGKSLDPVTPNLDIKWEQLPDESTEGIDIRMDRNDDVARILADDFLCTKTGLITDIHFWGSWKDDFKTGSLTSIHLSLYSDIPAVKAAMSTDHSDNHHGDPHIRHSRPGKLLWEHTVYSGEYSETLYKDLCDPAGPICNHEWFWDTYAFSGQGAIPAADQNIWKYDILIDPNLAFQQEGTATDPIIYWLGIWVETSYAEEQFGWKTSISHWNDDAVYGDSSAWLELLYPSKHPFANDSIDLSFQITTTEPPLPETEACCLEDGTCVDITVSECLQKNGTPQGIGTACSDPGIQCPQPPPPVVACCLPDGTCIDTTVGKCKKYNGSPQASGSSCSDPGISCPQPCRPQAVDCPNGTISTSITKAIGLQDNFAPGPDLGAAPDLILQNYIVNCSAPGIPLQLDEIPGLSLVPFNSWFGHTFTGLPNNIESATLEIRIRATEGPGDSGTFNDHISFISGINGCSPTYAWAKRLMHLPESNGTWGPGQTATFCLDLGNLIPDNSGTTSILNQLETGTLSLRVDDDSGVDYIILRMATCPCRYPLDHKIQVELPDNFSSPDSAPASPSTELTTSFTSLRGFDTVKSNLRFAHTFTGLPPAITGAELEIGLRAHLDIPTNDSIAIEYLNPSFRWSKKISDLPTLPPGNATPIGAWPAGTSQVFILDLDDLPASVSGVTSVIGDMSNGTLDIYIQDDTAVDYMVLRLKLCCDDSIPGDNDNDGDVDLVDFSIMTRNWLVQ